MPWLLKLILSVEGQPQAHKVSPAGKEERKSQWLFYFAGIRTTLGEKAHYLTLCYKLPSSKACKDQVGVWSLCSSRPTAVS